MVIKKERSGKEQVAKLVSLKKKKLPYQTHKTQLSKVAKIIEAKNDQFSE